MPSPEPIPRPDAANPGVSGMDADCYRLLVEQSPDGIFLSDADGRYLDVNPAGAAMLGYTREELLRMRIPDIHHPEEVGRIPPVIARYANGAVVTSEWRFVRKDGTIFLGELVGARLPDGRLQGILRDVTERRRAETALRESESFHRQVLDSIPGIVFTARADRYCDYFSRQLTDYSGVPVEDALGEKWLALVHPADRPRAAAAWKDAIAANADYEVDLRLRDAEGDYEWFKVSGKAIRDADGKVVRWFGIGTNVDDLRRAEHDLAEGESLLRLITDNSEDRIFILDHDFRLLFVNPAAEREIRAAGTPLAKSARSVRGLNAFELFGHGDMAHQLQAADQAVITSGKPLTVEETIDTPAGKRYMLASRWPFRNRAGEVVGIVGITRNITESKHAEADRLAKLARQRDALVREVHHRVKNHLQGVLGLMRNAVDERPQLAEPMGDIIARMHAIVGVFGLQSQRPDARVRLCDLVRIAVDAIASPAALSCQLPTPGTEAILAPEEAVPAALIVNELLTNAVKHLDAAAGDGSVSVALRIGEAVARLSIANRPARLPTGFDFTSGHGLGTGLQLVRSLMPTRHAELAYRQEGDMLVTELSLMPPNVTLVGGGP